MKKYFLFLIMVVFSLSLMVQSSQAETWKKIVNGGFGDSKNDYAWSMEKYKNKLYVGTLNLSGAEIWRTIDSEATGWERVYKSRANLNYGIRCLYADGNDALYACTSNNFGAQILKSTNGKTWTTVGSRGLGNLRNMTIRCMIRFGDYLYVGMGSDAARLFRSKDGTIWESVKTKPDLASTVIPTQTGARIINNVMIGELAVFYDHLYAFTWTKDAVPKNILLGIGRSLRGSLQESKATFLAPTPGAFEVWRSRDGVNWEKLVGQDDKFGNGLGFSCYDPENIDNDVVTSVTTFQGQLYLGTEHDYGRTSIWRTFEGTRWEKVLDFHDLGEKFNYYIWRMMSFDNKLFIGTFNVGLSTTKGVTGAQIWGSDSGDPGTFYNLIHDGFDGESAALSPRLKIPKNYGLRSFGILNGSLFVGTATMPGLPLFRSNRSANRSGRLSSPVGIGCEIWKLIP